MARDLNRTVRSWCAYFSYGSVTTARHHVEQHLSHSVRRFLRLGANRDAQWPQDAVATECTRYAVTLTAVTMA